MRITILIFTFCLLLVSEKGYAQQGNTICEEALDIAIGDLITITQEASVELPSTTCYSERLNGYWYQIEVSSGVVEVEYIKGNSNYAQVQILSGICNNLICLGSNEVLLGESTYFATSADSVYLFFRSTNYEVANTEFRVRRINIVENYTCDKPTPLNCNEFYPIVLSEEDYVNNNDERWFSIEGKNEVVSLYFPYNDYDFSSITTQVLKKSCNQDSIIAFRQIRTPKYQSLNFFGELGANYYVKIRQSFSSEGVMVLQMDCGNAPDNDFCEAAIDIEAGELIVGNDNFSLYESSFFIDDCVGETYRSLWYKIVGKDSIIDVQVDNGMLIGMRADSCCGSRRLFYDVEPKFFGEQDIPYYVQIGSNSDDYNYDIQLKAENIPTLPNSICTAALELDCSEKFTVDFEQTVGEVFFKIEGDGNVKELTLEESKIPSYAISYNVRVYTASCEAIDFSNTVLSESVRSAGDKIQFKAELDQSYIMRIFTYSDLLDTTYWSANCILSVSNDNCEYAHKMDVDSIVQGTTSGATFEHFHDDCTFNRNGDVWYVFEGDGNVNTINLLSSSKFPLAMDIYNGECGNLTCFRRHEFYSEYSPKSLTLRSIENEDYYFVFYSEEVYDSIDFKFQILSSVPPPNDICTGAYDIFCGQEYTDSTNLASSEIYSYSCYNNSAGIWYKYMGTGNIAEFELLQSSSSRVFVSVFQESCGSTTCIAVNDELEYFSNNKLYWKTEAGMEYFILLSNGYSSSAEFKFKITCNSFPPSDNNCELPQIVQCADTVSTDNSFATPDTISNIYYDFTGYGTWSRFMGDGNLYNIEVISSDLEDPTYRILTGNSCDSLVLLSNPPHSRSELIRTEVGEYYYIFYTGSDSQDRGITNYIINCVDPISNDECNVPYVMGCDDNFQIDFNKASVDLIGFNYFETKVWFKLIGNGEVNHFNVDSSTIYNNEVVLYERNNCDSLITKEVDNLNSKGAMFFFAEENVEYLISVGENSSSRGVKKTWVSLSCYNQASNDYIESPYEIRCNELVNINTHGGSEEGDPFCRTYNSRLLWYKFEGNNSILNITGSPPNFYERVSVSLFIDDGSDRLCVGDFELYGPSDTIEILTYANVNYLLGFGGGYDGTLPLNGDFYFDCKPSQSEDACFNAPLLTCGDVVNGSSKDFHPDFHLNCGSMGTGENAAWYKINGNDQYYEVTYSVDLNYNLLRLYQGDCYSPICIANGNSIRFYAESDQEYLLGAYGRSFGDIYDYTLSLSCFDSTNVNNDLCSYAIPIQCGEIYDAQFLDATLDEEAGLCGPTNNPGIWYSIEGNGDLMELQLVDKNDYRDVGIKIYQGINCDELICLSEGEIDRYKRLSFRTNVSEQYFIQILKIDDLDNFCFSLSCRDLHSNDICEDAIELKCGYSYSISLEDVFLNDNINECTSEINREAVWFKIDGIGDSIYIHDLLPKNRYNEEIMVFSGSCTNCEELVELERIGTWVDKHRYYKFNTILNKSYYIPISFRSITNSSSFGFNVSCNRKIDFTHFEYCPSDINIDFRFIDEINFSPPDIDYSGLGVNCDIQITSSLDTLYSLGENIYTNVWLSTDCFGRQDTCIQSISITNDKTPLIQGPSLVCRGGKGKYFVDSILNAENYIWSYSGDGEIVQVSATEIELNFGENYEGGALELILIGLGDTLKTTIQLNIAAINLCEIVNCTHEYIHIPNELMELGMLPSEIKAIFEISTDGVIDSFENYFYQAGRSIELMPGFEILENGSISAEIKNCKISE